jgi:hypothetical protein
MDITRKIKHCIALIEHAKTPEAERDAARRLLDGLKRKAAKAGQDVSAESETWSGYYRLPAVKYGGKYSGWLSSTEIAARIRADIALARKLGRLPATSGEVKVPCAIGDAPAAIKFSVRKEDYSGGRAVDITIKGVPSDWWITQEDPYNRARTCRIPGPQLKALRQALQEITWAYNYDGSDAQVDYFNRNFYDHYRADGHGEGNWLRDI